MAGAPPPAGAGREALAAYNHLVAAERSRVAEQAAALAEDFRRAGVTFAGQPMRSFLRPHLMSRSAWDALRAAGVRLLELGARVARQAFDGRVELLLEWLGTPPAEARHVRHDPGPPDVLLSRLDAFMVGDRPRFIEINSDAPAGFGYGDRMAELFSALPLFRRFAAAHRVAYQPSAPPLVAAVLAAWSARGRPGGSGGGGRPRVGILDWADVKTRADQELLRLAFERAGVEAVLADPRDCRRTGGRLWCPQGALDLVYRRAVLSELVERPDDARALLDAYAAGEVLVVNSLRCRLSEDKAFFALLTDESFEALLAPAERAFVRAVVPWTRKLEARRTLDPQGRSVDLLEFAGAEREHLVLKPAHGYGGREVFVGDETDAATWQAALQAGLGRPWVVQERVLIPHEPFPVVDDDGRLTFEELKVNTNPFYVAGAEVGAVTRVSRQSVINVSAGGGSVPTFIVED